MKLQHVVWLHSQVSWIPNKCTVTYRHILLLQSSGKNEWMNEIMNESRTWFAWYQVMVFLSFFPTVLDRGKVKHYKIRKTDTGEYFVSRNRNFPTLKQLVEHYSKQEDGLCVRLLQPCKKVGWLSSLFVLFCYVSFLALLEHLDINCIEALMNFKPDWKFYCTQKPWWWWWWWTRVSSARPFCFTLTDEYHWAWGVSLSSNASVHSHCVL